MKLSVKVTGLRIVEVLGILASAVCAEAQFVAVRMNVPDGTVTTEMYGGRFGQVVGLAYTPERRAMIWTGPNSTPVDITPSVSGTPFVLGTDGLDQVGSNYTNDRNHAVMWSGTAASWKSLHPSHTANSWASAVHNGVQVGSVIIEGNTQARASRWRGTAQSWQDIHPPGFAKSSANNIFNDEIVGTAHYNSGSAAALWTGESARFVNLHPDAADVSYGFGAYEGVQVGSARVDNVFRASLWRGSASTWVNLGGYGPWDSGVSAVWGNTQVGGTATTHWSEASLWRGTTASHVNLHAFLPSGYYSSYANGVWESDGVTYVYGSASSNGESHLFTWVSVPEPSSFFAVASGFLILRLFGRGRLR
ncbi:MAG TPA: hypothetical protein PKA27_01465 [Fimbriimonadaceae bacterium]|nr:hypothetical protein [Fimbriimonadaceae bacterium]